MNATQGLFAHLNLANPVLAAPMAGGASTPELVAAAATAGGFGFLAAGYKTPNELVDQIKAVRAANAPFAVNLFAPNPVPVELDAFRRYARAIQPEAERYGLDLGGVAPVEDDDFWSGKVDVLLDDPVPVVSFTFGIPERRVIEAFRAAGTVVLQTVTTIDEARLAADANVDGLVVQSSDAGAHSGTFTPARPTAPVPLLELVAHIRGVVGLPVVAAGGLGTAGEVAGVRRAGADAAMVGTVLLRTDESGASPTYKRAVAQRAHLHTVVTRSFTGRPARGLPNEWTDRYDGIAPLGYPALHHLTVPIRRAAAAAGDADRINLWAGTGARYARAEPAATMLRGLGAQA